MSKLNFEQRLESTRFRYAQHADSANWTERHRMRDRAVCGCGIMSTHHGTFEVICRTFDALGKRLIKLEDQLYPDWSESYE